MSTESVKIDKTTVVKIRKLVKQTKQTIGGFATITLEKELKRLKIK